MADSDTQRRPPAPRRAPNGKYWAWNNRGSGNWYLRDDLKNRAKYEEPEQEERKPSGRKERQLEDSNLEVEGERKKEDSTRPSPVSRRRRQYSPRPGDMLTEREVEPHEKDGLEDGDGPRPRTRRGLSPTSRREPRPSREIDPGIEDDVDTFRELRSLDGSDRLRGEVDSHRRQSLERRRERVQGRLSEHEDTLREAAQESDSSDLDDDEREQERVLAEARARQAAIARARQREQERLANERRGIDVERVRERRDDFGDDSERTPEGSEGIDPFVPEGELDIDRQVVDYEGPPAQTDREELIRKAALLEAEIRLGRRGRLPKQKLSSRLRTLASHAEMAREHSSEFDEEVGSVRDDLVDDSEPSEEDDSEVPGILGEIVSEAERPERDEPATEKRSQAAQFRPADQLRSSAEFDGEDIPDMLREVLSEVERPGLDKPAAGETAEADPITGESEGDPQTGDPLDSDSPAPDDSPTPSAEGAVSAEPTDSRPEHISTEFWSALTTDQQQRLSDGFEQYQTALGQYQSGESSREDAQTQADTYNSLIESVNSEVQTTYNRARADYSHAVAQGSIERYMGQLQHGWHVGNEVDVSGSELLEALRAHREAVSAVPEADRTPDIFERFAGRQEGLPTAGEEGADAFYATRDIKQHLAWGKDHVQFEQSLEGGQLGRPPKGSVVRSEAEQDKFLSEWEERLSNVDPTALSEEEQQGLVELVNKVATERKNLRIHNRDLERRAAKREAWQEQMRQSDRQADAVMLSRLANWKTDPNKKDVYQSQVQQYIAQGKGNTAQRQKRMQELVDTGIVEQPSAADPVDSQAVDPDTQPVEALGETVGHGPPRSIYDASIAGGSNRPTGAPPGRGGPPSTATEARKPESETPTKFLPAEPPKLSSDSDVAAFQMRDYERQQLLAATAANQGEEAAERLSEMFGQTKYRLPGRTNEAYGVWLKNEVASQLPEGSDIDAFMREVDSAAYSAMKEVGGTATREERQAAHLTALHGALEGAADNAIKSWQVAQTEKATTDFLGQIADDDERAKAQSLVDQHGLQAGAQLFIDELNQQREDSVKINSADEAVVSQWVANLPAAYREQAQSLIAQHGTGEGLLKTIEHMKTDEYKGFDPSDPHAGLGPDDSESVWLTPASRVQSLYDRLDAPIQSVLNKQFIEQAKGDVTRGGQHLTDWFAGLGEQNTQLVDDFNRDLVVQYTKKLPDEIAAQAAEAAGAAPHAAAANEAVQSIYREWLDKQPQFAQGDAASPTPIGDTVEMDELGMGLSDSYTKTPEFSPAQLRDYLVTHGQERRELTSNIEVLKEEAASAQIKDYLITQGQEQKELESNIEGLRDEASRDPVVFQQHLETKGQEDREIASNIEAQQRGVDDPDAKLYAEAVRHFRNPEDWKHDP
ncbi:MAG: hypothetical protein J4G14_02530, partial [Dehalococcoidia bacterium]|nr:hypothetical protein [Dehalococcoidia bacterium]